MAHRGVPDRGPRWKLARDLLLLAVLVAVASVVYILLSLVLRGTVSW